MSNSLWSRGLQHARLPCPSPTPRVYSNLCPLSQWCLSTISSSFILFSSCLQSFPASASFQMSQLFALGGQSIGVSATASVLPKNIQDWFPLGWISLQSKGLSRAFSNTTVQEHQFFSAQLSLQSNSHIHTWLLKKTIALTRKTFVGKAMSLHFNTLSRLVVTFLPKCSFGISNVLEEICSPSHSITLLYFFAWLLRKAFLSLPASLWNSAFKWVYLSFSPLPFVFSLLSYLQGLLGQPFCLFAFLFLGNGLDHCFQYNVTNFCP